MMNSNCERDRKKIGSTKFNKKWEVSIAEFMNSKWKRFKVTRRFPELSVSETKVFRTKEEAKKQFNEWLE